MKDISTVEVTCIANICFPNFDLVHSFRKKFFNLRVKFLHLLWFFSNHKAYFKSRKVTCTFGYLR